METTPIVSSSSSNTFLHQLKQWWRSIDQKKFLQITTLTVVALFVLLILATTISNEGENGDEDQSPFLYATPTPVLYKSVKKPNSSNPSTTNLMDQNNSNIFTTFNNGELFIRGIGKTFVPLDTSIISKEDPLQIKGIIITNAIINAPEFSFVIQNLTNLESLMMINVTIIGTFNRVYLPELRKLFIDQYIEMSDTLRHYQERIHSYLFFDKVQDSPWKMAEVANQGVNITYIVGGFTFLRIRQSLEMLLYFDDCDQILKNTNMSYTVLSLATCNFSVDSIPSNLIYFNYYDAKVVSGSVSELFQKLNKLEHLYLDLPNNTVDLSDFPKTLSVLSLSSVNLIYNGVSNASTIFFPNLTELYIGYSNISKNIFEEFRNFVPNLQRLAAIGPETATYEILERAITAEVNWILMENLNRTKGMEYPKTENELIRAGVESDASNFIIIRPKYSEFFVAIPVEGGQNRFVNLGWYKFLTYGAFTVADKYMP